MENFYSDSIIINDASYNLGAIEILAWKKLVNGAVKKKNGFRNMCVGTVGESNNTSLRIVINRKVDEQQKIIYFHTDNRSRKYADLEKDNRVSLLFYDAKQSVQITIKAHAILHSNDEISKDRWNATNAQARLGYMTQEAPNTKSDQPTLGYEERFATSKPTVAESDVFEKNFTVIACQVYELEFLYLSYHGNRKANFYYKNGVLTDRFWAVP